MQGVEEAPGQPFLRAHGTAGEQQLAGAALADHTWQQGAGTHVGTGQADAGEQEGGPGGGGAVAQIAGQRHHGAGAGADAVDGADDGLRTAAHGLDQIARHAGELQQLGHAHLRQRADDVVHVAAGAEVATLARQHHHLHVGGVAQAVEQVAQLGVAVEGERVLAFRAVERDGGHAGGVAGPAEMLRLVARTRAELRAHGVGAADVVLHTVSCCSCLTLPSKVWSWRASASDRPWKACTIQVSCASAMALNWRRPLAVRRTR